MRTNAIGLVFHLYILAFAILFALMWSIGWAFVPLTFGFAVFIFDVVVPD